MINSRGYPSRRKPWVTSREVGFKIILSPLLTTILAGESPYFSALKVILWVRVSTGKCRINSGIASAGTRLNRIKRYAFVLLMFFKVLTFKGSKVQGSRFKGSEVQRFRVERRTQNVEPGTWNQSV